ncbi:MAG: hypothetical protein ACTFAL_00260 [Candidatus Electronema sp. V4]|uniref:hypothetical protein n=1 Tax=Candidatus Electronema sp. V4 TaxID=3454756 RepID=UPI0040554850
MFDGLIEVLMSWLQLAFCFIVEQLVTLAVSLMQLVSAVMPSVAIPDALTSVAWPAQSMIFVSWIFPTNFLGILFLAWISYEIAHFVLLILYRAFMDLL